ncbi:MAG: hypothetical protein ABL898_06840 [Hyphomicrobiaceae bacterium]
MTASNDMERRPSSLKSLLERLEEADKIAEQHTGEGKSAESKSGAADDKQRMVGEVRDNVVPVRRRRPVELTPQLSNPLGLDNELGRAIERRAAMVESTAAHYRLPLILGVAAVAGAVVALPVAYFLLAPSGDGGAKSQPGVASLSRAIETKVTTTAELVPLARAAPAGTRDDAAVRPDDTNERPRLVLTPEPRTRRVAVEPIVRAETPPAVPEAIARSPVLPLAIAPPTVPSGSPVMPRVLIEKTVVMRSGTRALLPVRIEPASGLQAVTRVVVRGMPSTAIVLQSTRGPAGSLMVMPDAMASLVIDLTSVPPGESEIEIELQGAGQAVLDRVTTVLAVTPAIVAPTAIREAAPPPASADTANPRGDAFLSKGRQLFSTGDVAGARLMLERALEVGSKSATLLLGETYDPAGLAARGVRGMTADVKQARAWYEKARTLGIAEAEDRLRRLPAQ